MSSTKRTHLPNGDSVRGDDDDTDDAHQGSRKRGRLSGWILVPDNMLRSRDAWTTGWRHWFTCVQGHLANCTLDAQDTAAPAHITRHQRLRMAAHRCGIDLHTAPLGAVLYKMTRLQTLSQAERELAFDAHLELNRYWDTLNRSPAVIAAERHLHMVDPHYVNTLRKTLTWKQLEDNPLLDAYRTSCGPPILHHSILIEHDTERHTAQTNQRLHFARRQQRLAEFYNTQAQPGLDVVAERIIDRCHDDMLVERVNHARDELAKSIEFATHIPVAEFSESRLLAELPHKRQLDRDFSSKYLDDWAHRIETATTDGDVAAYWDSWKADILTSLSDSKKALSTDTDEHRACMDDVHTLLICRSMLFRMQPVHDVFVHLTHAMKTMIAAVLDGDEVHAALEGLMKRASTFGERRRAFMNELETRIHNALALAQGHVTRYHKALEFGSLATWFVAAIEDIERRRPHGLSTIDALDAMFPTGDTHAPRHAVVAATLSTALDRTSPSPEGLREWSHLLSDMAASAWEESEHEPSGTEVWNELHRWLDALVDALKQVVTTLEVQRARARLQSAPIEVPSIPDGIPVGADHHHAVLPLLTELSEWADNQSSVHLLQEDKDALRADSEELTPRAWAWYVSRLDTWTRIALFYMQVVPCREESDD